MNIPFQTITDQDLLKARLFNRARLAESGCWIWVGSKDASGYGLMSVNGKTARAHRISCGAFNGQVPDGMVVRHSCDNPSCINPAHLGVGTQQQNVADREARGRRDVRGEQVGTAKLSVSDVVAIRNSKLSLSVLAKMYGVDKSNIWTVRSGKSWAHVGNATGHERN